MRAMAQGMAKAHAYAASAAEGDPAVYGADKAYLSLRGRCFDSAEVSEKTTLGGTSNTVPRTYVFRVCPFVNVTQHEPGPAGWVEVSRRRRAGSGRAFLPASGVANPLLTLRAPSPAASLRGTSNIGHGVWRRATDAEEGKRKKKKKAKAPEPVFLGRFAAWIRPKVATPAVDAVAAVALETLPERAGARA